MRAPRQLINAIAVIVIAIAACTPRTEITKPIPPTITVLARGLAPASVIATIATEVYVGETFLGARPSSVESRVRSVPTVGGVPQLRSETQHSGEITGLALATDGTLYLSRRASPVLSDSTVSAYRGGQETVLATGSDAPADESLRSPAGIAVAPSGDLIVADSVGSQILRFVGGKFERFAGSGLCTSRPLGPPTPGPALKTALCGPELLAVDRQSNTYVARKGARWVAKIDRGGVLSLVANNLDMGGLATDSVGSLLVSEGTLGQIIRYRGDQSTILVTGLSRPTGIAVGADGAIYVVVEGTGDLLKIVIH